MIAGTNFMNNSSFQRMLSVVFLVFLAGLGSERCFATDSCSLAKPPLDSAVSGDHGVYLFVYPRHVPENYTGCQTMWDEFGSKVYVYRFVMGELRDYSLAVNYPGSAVKRCRYRNHKLTLGSWRECSEYARVRDGIPNVESNDEPLVPRERDPRRR